MAWGVVSTVLAPMEELQRHIAWHLSLGAAVVYVYLDDANAEQAAELNRHPQVQAVPCTQEYWKDTFRMRPRKLPVRQVVNANHAYRNCEGIEWLAHIDVDEFMLPHNGLTVDRALNPLEDHVLMARMPVVESLAAPDGSLGGRMYFKACHSDETQRLDTTKRLYPEYGSELNGGFIGHIQGKVFVRTGVTDLSPRVHTAAINGQEVGEVVLPLLEIGHLHAPNWDGFIRHFKTRMAEGSYTLLNPRAPARRVQAMLNRNALFSRLMDEGGEDAVKRMFDTVAAAKDPLLTNLRNEGLLREYDMSFEKAVDEYFLN